MTDILFNQEGPLTAVRYQPSFSVGRKIFAAMPAMYGFFAVSDGVNWSVVPLVMGQQLPANAEDAMRRIRWTKGKTLGHLPIDARLLYRWALDGYKTRGQAVAFSAPAEAKPANITVVIPGGMLVSRGYDLTIGKNPTRTEQDVLRLLAEAIRHVESIWHWSPTPLLEVHYHDESWKAMGAAFDSGRAGPKPATRLMSLRRDLVRDYDDLSISRVCLHELCHFYRDENWPRTPDDHDERFVELLSQVDKNVHMGAKFFAGALSAVAAAKEKAKADKVVWTVDAGLLRVKRLKDGGLRAFWEPREAVPKNLRWRPVAIRLDDHGVLELARRFSLSDRARGLVLYDERAATYRDALASRVKLPPEELRSLHNFLLSFSAFHQRTTTLEFLVQEVKDARST